MRTALVLIRGSYSGLLKPDDHYIPIEKDYSNIDAALERINDLPELQAMADRTFRCIVEGGSNHYSSFVARMDALITQAVERKSVSCAATLSLGNAATATKRPLGHDPYLVEQNRRLAKDYAALRNDYHALTDKLIGSYKESDRLVALLEEVGGERNRAADNNLQLRERLSLLEAEYDRLLRQGVQSAGH